MLDLSYPRSLLISLDTVGKNYCMYLIICLFSICSSCLGFGNIYENILLFDCIYDNSILFVSDYGCDSIDIATENVAFAEVLQLKQ